MEDDSGAGWKALRDLDGLMHTEEDLQMELDGRALDILIITVDGSCLCI